MSIVQTVLGAVDASALGRTLTHEHVTLDFEHFYRAPPSEFVSPLAQRISMQTLGYVRQYPYSSRENLHFADAETQLAVVRDVELYKRYGGGGTIVENSSYGLQRNLAFIVDLAQRTGVHFVAGTGHYIQATQQAQHSSMSLEQLVDLYAKELSIGIDGTDVQCGFIGEVASVYPLKDFEQRAIRAAGEVQATTGCPVSFHPHRLPEAPFEIMRLYLEAGGRADKCVMSHIDRTFYDFERLLEFAELGSYIQYDLFGTECSYYQLNPATTMISDGQRIDNIMRLIDEGLAERVLMSHDIHTKHRLTAYGGHGFHHINMNVLPRMLAKGVTPAQIEQLTVKNPAKWLAYRDL